MTRPAPKQRDRIRQQLSELDGDQCVRCGSRIDINVDHIIPRAAGGCNRLENLQLYCEPCNSQKRNHPDLKMIGMIRNDAASIQLYVRWASMWDVLTMYPVERVVAPHHKTPLRHIITFRKEQVLARLADYGYETFGLSDSGKVALIRRTFHRRPDIAEEFMFQLDSNIASSLSTYELKAHLKDLGYDMDNYGRQAVLDFIKNTEREEPSLLRREWETDEN